MSPQADIKPKKKWETKYLTVWDSSAKSHVFMSLTESVQDIITNWGFVDYGVDSNTFNEDSKNITTAMKKLGYYPVANYVVSRVENTCVMTQVSGSHKPRGGAYYFEHYTQRKKVVNGERASA